MAKYVVITMKDGSKSVTVRSALETASEDPLTEYEEIIIQLLDEIEKLKKTNLPTDIIKNIKSSDANHIIDIVNLIKDNIAKKHGYPDDIMGTRWEYAMIITHRRKMQIQLYEEALVELAFYILQYLSKNANKLFCTCKLPTNTFQLDDGTICCCKCEKEILK